MAALKQDISEQAAEAAQRHKFNSGATEPTGDSSPRRLTSGLAATAEVGQDMFEKTNGLECWRVLVELGCRV
jgi:hypothetical protein